MRREGKFVGVCLAAALTILYKLLTMCAFPFFFLFASPLTDSISLE